MALANYPALNHDYLNQTGLTLANAQAAAALIGQWSTSARTYVLNLVSEGGKVNGDKVERQQLALHAMAYLATIAESAREMADFAARLQKSSNVLEYAQGLSYAGILMGELPAAIDLGTGEKVIVSTIGLDTAQMAADIKAKNLTAYVNAANSTEFMAALAGEIESRNSLGDGGLDDETLQMIQDQFRKWVNGKVLPVAHEIHSKDILIPLEMIQEMADMGVFGLTIPEKFGGSGLSKLSMVLVTEELSRGYIGVGSIGTRAEIAAELILAGGTEEQKQKWLPKLASGEVLPTAVFTEPSNGSDLANLKARADKVDGGYKITGQKTWITHASRTDIMTVLVRSLPNEKGYKGLSMFIAEKPRVMEDTKTFKIPGMEASELPVLGYRGMKEYELSFDGYFVPEANLLGGQHGNGFKQLMTTFEAARIQTAARAVGVAVGALETGLKYAHERVQFGKQTYNFPRVFNKVARISVLIQAARQLTYFSARQKDAEKRCDLEAGMAKLYAAWIAQQAADAALQIHGGNGYSMEFPVSRLFVDARVLSIFEGAAEIQATVIGRRLIEG